MSDGQASPAATQSETLESLLEYLKDARGFDFSGYKRGTLERRIRKRMEEVEVEELAEYQDLLEVTPEEFANLFDTILINVTGFFRDPQAWEYVAKNVVPRIIDSKPAGAPIRVWSAACSSGEEAYTVAMLFAEALGEEEFRARMKIYATDVDEDALNTARNAIFPVQTVKSIPDDLLAKYFDRNSKGYAFRPDLRRAIIFGRNDLVQDAPISRIDLLVSRNALMYFTREAQTRILGRFNFALSDTGFLFLGKSEMLIGHSDLFTPEDLKWRVFRKVPRHGMGDRLPLMDERDRAAPNDIASGEIRGAATDAMPIAQVVVDRNGTVVLVNQRARATFGLGAADVGRAFHDLPLSYQPLDLRSALEQAYEQGTPVSRPAVPWLSPDGRSSTLNAIVIPVRAPNGNLLGASITFDDVTEFSDLDEQHKQAQVRLETAYDQLQSTVEELETTNEELQSTNEELETTNEELQSTNEELETMNEELQSTNEELEAMNDEQRARAREMDRLNLFLEGILGNLGVGVAVLDEEQRVQIWNESAFELWGLRAEEVEGHHLQSLDMGMPLDALWEPIRLALGDEAKSSEVVLDAVNRRGRTFRCEVRVLPLASPQGRRYGAIMLMSEQDG